MIIEHLSGDNLECPMGYRFGRRGLPVDIIPWNAR
jgi:hypothetical protein